MTKKFFCFLLFFFSHFSITFLHFNKIAPDGILCSVASHLGLYYLLMIYIYCARRMTLII